MNTNAAYKLKIIAGVHKNAELTLTPEIEYLIGSSDECDIIMMDEGIEADHLGLCLSQDCVHLTRNSAVVFVDGKALKDKTTEIKALQIITIGKAHLAVGPAHEAWPLLVPPVLKTEADPNDSLALVPINTSNETDHTVKDILLNYMRAVDDFIAYSNRKILAAAIVFILFFCSFWIDFISSTPSATADESDIAIQKKLLAESRGSHILSFIKVMTQVREETLVGTGVEEPPVKIEKEVLSDDDPVQHVREVLREKWGPALSETKKNENEIEFRGYDSQNQMDLALNLNRELDGDLSAQGYTLSRRQRKEIVAHLGDVIRMKVIAADDVENLCRKTLQKKKIKHSSAHFDIEKKAVTLGGEADDHKLIASIEEIVSNSLPDVAVENRVAFTPGKLDIVGVNTTGIEYITLGDGSKIFPGGKLKNGCIVETIFKDGIQLNCYGSMTYQKIGENS